MTAPLVPFGELGRWRRSFPRSATFPGILPGRMQQMATDGFRPGPGPAVIYADQFRPLLP